jgi:hypothetical protein
MPQAGIDQLYFGTENWNIPTASFTGYQAAFSTPTTRNPILDSAVYADGAGKKSIVAFLSYTSAKQLAGSTLNKTLRSTIVGVSILFGFDTNAEKIVLIARSANGRAARPAGTEFTNFNFLSKPLNESNPNVGLLDTEVTDLVDDFKTSGYTYLENLSSGVGVAVKFDNLVLARLLYSDVLSTSTEFPGQTTFHLVIAPPWEAQAGAYLSLAGEGSSIHRGLPPCPPYCYQGV